MTTSKRQPKRQLIISSIDASTLSDQRSPPIFPPPYTHIFGGTEAVPAPAPPRSLVPLLVWNFVVCAARKMYEAPLILDTDRGDPPFPLWGALAGLLVIFLSAKRATHFKIGQRSLYTTILSLCSRDVILRFNEDY